ncbi:type 2 lantibiotic biosynthesis protein LanM [Kitasatospora sp. GAS204A]|uniref:type 2 lanthipeptide synthetase LanM family protein n=1 Tax=unclassified Kitasatospora TaxID=2633591 RepID=UPI002476C1F9|nr:type 2 lanthipeptide synthetase LanM family protein [Kitasatospora sp. GAS204B]MDH6118558.1 type 2 lantibiotic biosynthesis protein LanM [Kitasatospora sp. GAS204B]
MTPGQPRSAQPPDWAAFVEQAIEAAPPTAGRRVAELPGTAGFAVILAPLAELAADRLAVEVTEIGGVDLPAVRGGFVDRLARRLAQVAARTLVLELNVARVAGSLVGDTSSDRFDDFVRQASGRPGLSRLFSEYVVLARLLAQASLRAGAATAELLGRFGDDRALIVDGLLAGRDPGPLVEVESGVGDGHRQGRSVSVLRFASGARVVYKPRSLAAHGHFNEVARWLDARLGRRELRTLALLERPGYGWVEFVEQRPCTAPRQVERFYFRQGVLLALLHALDTTDVHHENLIACADDPVLVDLETLFHPVPPVVPVADPAARVLASSVYRTGLLPQLRLGDETAWDMSGLGADKDTALPFAGVEFAAAGTDEMRLVRRPRVFAGARNRPVLDGREADPAAFTEPLLAGFRTGYRTIAAHRDELTGPLGLLHRFAEDEVRVVLRSSNGYARLLEESSHPDVLRDAAERDRLLELIRAESIGNALLTRVAEDEIAQLWDGDIPLFTSRPGTADLWNGRGDRLAGVLGTPGLRRAIDKIDAMDAADKADGTDGTDETDRRGQEWIILATMAARSTGLGDSIGRRSTARVRSGPTCGAPDPDRLLTAACRIGDQLVALAHQDEHRTNWLGLELLDQRYWRLGPLGADLADGYGGIALFLAQLSRITGSARYAEPARQALRPVPGLLAALAEHPDQLGYVGTGGFAGLGGIAYALTQVATALDDDGIGAWVEPAVQLISTAVGADPESGVFTGKAGGLAALLAVHRATGSAAAWQAAQACADRLVERPLPARTGFAFGSAGIGWALLAFTAAGGGPRFTDAGLAALRSAASRSAVAPRAEEPQSEPGSDDLSWCHGLAGLALAVADSPLAAADPQLAPVLDRALRGITASDPPADHSLCHGELAVLELLHVAAPSPEAAAVAEAALARRAGRLLAALEHDGPRCGTPGAVPHPGLLTGLAGIGHGLLRLGFADHVPSALLLRPPAANRPSGARP